MQEYMNKASDHLLEWPEIGHKEISLDLQDICSE